MRPISIVSRTLRRQLRFALGLALSWHFPRAAPARLSAPLGRVAEWQTRTVQVRVSVRTWGFKSPLAHILA